MTTEGNTLDFSTVDHRQNRLRPVEYTKNVPATNKYLHSSTDLHEPGEAVSNTSQEVSTTEINI